MKKIFSVILTVAAIALVGCTCKSSETFKEAADPVALSEEAQAAWNDVKCGLHGAWGSFLKDFTNHLREKGWLHITNIAIDERAPKDMDEAARVIKKYAPELGFAMADNHDSYNWRPFLAEINNLVNEVGHLKIGGSHLLKKDANRAR